MSKRMAILSSFNTIAVLIKHEYTFVEFWTLEVVQCRIDEYE